MNFENSIRPVRRLQPHYFARQYASADLTWNADVSSKDFLESFTFIFDHRSLIMSLKKSGLGSTALAPSYYNFYVTDQ